MLRERMLRGLATWSTALLLLLMVATVGCERLTRRVLKAWHRAANANSEESAPETTPKARVVCGPLEDGGHKPCTNDS